MSSEKVMLSTPVPMSRSEETKTGGVTSCGVCAKAYPARGGGSGSGSSGMSGNGHPATSPGRCHAGSGPAGPGRSAYCTPGAPLIAASATASTDNSSSSNAAAFKGGFRKVSSNGFFQNSQKVNLYLGV